MHSTIQTPIIGTKESVYRDSGTGILEEATLVRSMLVPHKFRFYCDSKACLPVTVHHLTASYTFKQGIDRAMPILSHSTAVAAPFRGVVWINLVKRDIFVEAPAFKSSLEDVNRHSQDLFIVSPAFGFESLKFFDADVGIVFQSQVGNVSDNFAYSITDKILFLVPEHEQLFGSFVASFIGVALEDAPTSYNLLTLDPDVLAEIELPENLAFWGEDRKGKAFAVYIDADNIPFVAYRLLLGKISNNLSVRSKAIGLACPSVLHQGIPSLIVPVFADGDTDRLMWVRHKFDESEFFGFKDFAVPGDIEFDSNVLDGFSFGFGNRPFNVANHLAIKGGVLFAN